jgi:C4-dicarboxylate-binding protein DctP
VPKDFEKTLIRTTPGMVATLEALGAKGVRMNVDEVYMALQRGTVDGCLSAPSSATNRRWEEVTKYSTIINMMSYINVALINLNFWNKLPADVQKIMLEGNQEAEIFVEAIAEKELEEALKILTRKTQIYFPKAEEIDLWEKATQPVIDNYVKKGGPLVKEAVEEINRIKMKAKKS